MRTTSSMSSAAVRSGCTTIASARSSGAAGTGMNNTIAVHSSAVRRISEEDREGRFDSGRGFLGAVIGKQVLALQDDERPGLVGEAEDAGVHRRLRCRLVEVLVALDQVESREHLLHRLQ